MSRIRSRAVEFAECLPVVERDRGVVTDAQRRVGEPIDSPQVGTAKISLHVLEGVKVARYLGAEPDTGIRASGNRVQ